MKRKLNKDGQMIKAQFSIIGVEHMPLSLTLQYQNQIKQRRVRHIQSKKELLTKRLNLENPFTNSHENLICMQCCICI